MPKFKLSQRSLDRLDGVHPVLVNVVKSAIMVTKVDFGITCGVRDLATQKKLKAAGKSWTLKSNHLPQEDGYSHAVDCVAYIDGDVCWEIEVYDEIADAFREAADGVRQVLNANFDITWGAAWHKPITEWNGTCEELCNEYVDLRRSQGRRVSMDGPHFQIENIS